MSHFTEKVLMCRDCGQEFVFSVGEQEFYSTRGFTDPTRCPDCRAARKTARESGGASAGYGQSSGYGSSSRGGYTSGGSGHTSQGTRQMYKVICADCGQETEVPFEPRNGRPVYCRDCFERRNGRR